MSRIAIIDGDVLAYGACRSRWQQSTDGFEYLSLDDDGKRAVQEFTKDEDRRYLEDSWGHFQKDLEELLEAVFCTDFLMAVKSGQSYRDRMYPIDLPADGAKPKWGYKANRWKPEGERNKFVESLRELAIFEDLAVPAHDREADDLLRIWANQAREAGGDYVICSIDKDLKCIPGMHYLMKQRVLITVSQEEADRHYYQQLLKGDPTDNIPGIPRVGDVKAAALLADCKTHDEFQEAVISSYIGAYGDEWFSYFLSNAKMIHLQQHPHDFFPAREWAILRELCDLK